MMIPISTLLRVIVFAACFSWSTYIVVADSPKTPNVLFIIVDDLRPSLGCYGQQVMSTPNIDNLARKSVLFHRAYAQQASGGPSRVSLLTSRRPDSTRLYDVTSYWRKQAGDFTTLPQFFKHSGYFTQSAGKVFLPGRTSNFTDDYPLSWSAPAYHPPSEQYDQARVCRGPDGKLHKNLVCPVTVSETPGGTLPDIEISDFAVEFLQRRSARTDRPFFLAVGFHKPHIPFKFPKEYLEPYPLSDVHLASNPTLPLWLPPVAWNPWADVRHWDDVAALNVTFPYGPVPSGFQLKIRQGYYAATSFIDAQVGKVLSALDRNGLADNTIVVFTADHGWSLGEHQAWSKHSNFDVSTRVPLMFYVPGVTSQATSPGDNFPFRDVVTTRAFPSAQSLTAFGAEQPSQISSRLMSRMGDSRRRLKRSFRAGLRKVYPDLNPEKIRKVTISEEVPSVFNKKVDLFPEGHAHGGSGWKNIFKGNVLPFVTRVNLGHREKLTSKSSLDYRLALHIDRIHSHAALQHDEHSEYPLSTSAIAELVDIFPTLTELAGLGVLTTCPPDQFNVALCTEGSSLVPVIKNISRTYFAARASSQLRSSTESSQGSANNLSWKSLKKAAFSQYPRPSFEPGPKSDRPNVSKIGIMGYSIRTPYHRYTEWVDFNHTLFQADWTRVYAKELYLHRSDPNEDVNVAYFPDYSELVNIFSEMLRKGWRAALPS